MPQKLTANRSSAREARGLVAQMTCPTPLSPWPARGPLGRLREARQGPGEARTVATIGAGHQEDYDITRVKSPPLAADALPPTGSWAGSVGPLL